MGLHNETGDNYIRWSSGDKQNGSTKSSIVNEISLMIKIKVHMINPTF